MIRDLVESNPAIHAGEPVFAGTKVPVKSLLDYRRADIPVYEFLVDHPTVPPAKAKKFLKWFAAQGPAKARARLEQMRHGAA